MAIEEHTFTNVSTDDIPKILESAFGLAHNSTSGVADRVRERAREGQSVTRELLSTPDGWTVRVSDLEVEGGDCWLVRGERLL